MPPRSTMDQLIEVAGKKVDDAAQVLAARIARQRDAEAKLDMLVNYRTDYLDRFGTEAASGIEHHLLHNFHAFMDKLDAAIAEQHSIVTEARLGVRTAQNLWQAEQQRLKSYRVLAERRLGTERMREAKREQREQDEHASKAYVRSRASA